MSHVSPTEIQVAGDVCLDVVGIPVPPPSANVALLNNWQLTGETRTHYLLGGTLLLAELVRHAAVSANVQATQPCKPAELALEAESDSPLTPEEFLKIAERLTRDEIVHSLLALEYFPATPDAKSSDLMRVIHTHGFSGPKTGKEPSLPLLPPADPGRSPDIIVLDDTGNRFRRDPEQWPAWLTKKGDGSQPLVVYKLHRPLPCTSSMSATCGVDDSRPKGLWETVAHHHPEHRIVIVSIDDLRDREAPISRGLSWERTALDLVWQLLNVDGFAPLRNTPHLIVRMGLDGAVYWQHRLDNKDDKVPPYRAWLIYDPSGIEGTGDGAFEGKMVGYGSVFTAALVKHLAAASPHERLSLGRKPDIDPCLKSGIIMGLVASRRLLKCGFGKRGATQPLYPMAVLFSAPNSEDSYFGCQPIPIVPLATAPDRGYWRLLEAIFREKALLLHRAVTLTATGAQATEPEDEQAAHLLKQVPIAVFAKALRTRDRREIENYRALYALIGDYISQATPPRPLSIAVFGPPGAGKSFGVKQVAKALGQLGGPRPIESLAFNLSQYRTPDQLCDAFHQVRDLVLRAKIPLVFFDEFDTSLAGTQLGWLRYFLAPMQDGEFLDRGVPHPIGQAIFVFAGGTCGTYTEFAKPLLDSTVDDDLRDEFKSLKGPDFLSRLRGTLDIPGLNLNMTFDAYGPVDAFACEAAVLLRRAGIMAHQLGEKAPHLRDSSQGLRVSPAVLRGLLYLPQFEHGNRSFEALLDMSRLPEATRFTPSLLPASGHVGLHANATHLGQLLNTDYPFPAHERELIARSVHREYLKQRAHDANDKPEDSSLQDWENLRNDLKESNREQADDLAVKLRTAGLWFRKRVQAGAPVNSEAQQRLEQLVEKLARAEHDRWVAEKRRQGWIPAPGKDRKDRNDALLLHNSLFRWDELPEDTKQLDREPVRKIPLHLAAADYEIVAS